MRYTYNRKKRGTSDDCESNRMLLNEDWISEMLTERSTALLKSRVD